MTVLTGDCRELMPRRGPFGMIRADPSYVDTSLAWDRRVEGWLALAHAALRSTGSLWAFGSLRRLMATADRFLIRTSCPERGLVGDWFAESGVAGEACRLSGRRYIGCEIDAYMAERARARIASMLPFHDGGAS